MKTPIADRIRNGLADSIKGEGRLPVRNEDHCQCRVELVLRRWFDTVWRERNIGQFIPPTPSAYQTHDRPDFVVLHDTTPGPEAAICGDIGIVEVKMKSPLAGVGQLQQYGKAKIPEGPITELILISINHTLPASTSSVDGMALSVITAMELETIVRA